MLWMTKGGKILKISGIAVVVIAVLGLLSFVGSVRTSALCDDVLIDIHGNSDVILVSKPELKQQINAAFGVLVGVPLNKIDTKIIEESLVQMPQISEATVYKTIDRKLIVELDQRQPILRLLDQHGNSALLADCGALIPISDERPARLPVLSGAFSIAQSEDGLSLPDSVAMSVNRYATAVASSDFWEAQIQHSFFTAEGEFVAYPQVGKHRIEFGTAENIERKLAKLKVFYEEGISEANWNKYARINLKYKDQIVCTKK